jgi:hypothetical protein
VVEEAREQASTLCLSPVLASSRFGQASIFVAVVIVVQQQQQ